MIERLRVVARRVLSSTMLTRTIAAAALLFAAPSVSFAWGPEGHQIVALIAYAHLTPEAKAGTKALLGEGKDIYDAEVADWADVIRQAHRDLGPYHYVDADAAKRVIDLKNDGADGKNVVDGIVDQLKILRGDFSGRQIVLGDGDERSSDKSKDKTADRTTDAADDKQETREQALRWVVHLMGDVEQPLHCCDKNQDQGGNKVAVTFEAVKKPTNLHAVWDGAMLRIYVNDYLNSHHSNGNAKDPASGKEAPSITDYAMSLDAKITAQQRKQWAAGTPLDWANESHQLAAKYIYGDLPRGDPVAIDAGYVGRKKIIIETQLERGGVRLAAELNKVFAAQPTTKPSR